MSATPDTRLSVAIREGEAIRARHEEARRLEQEARVASEKVQFGHRVAALIAKFDERNLYTVITESVSAGQYRATIENARRLGHEPSPELAQAINLNFPGIHAEFEPGVWPSGCNKLHLLWPTPFTED